MIEKIHNIFTESIQTKIAAADALSKKIAKAGQLLVDCLLNEGKILCCGNGGSAINSQHFAAQMLNRFKRERPSLPAIDLSSAIVTMTAISNDYSFEEIFAKQVKALGNPADVLLTFTTDGNASNVIQATHTALSKDMLIIACSGKDGGEMAGLIGENDVEICVPSNTTARIHEVHLLITHILSELIDNKLFGEET